MKNYSPFNDEIINIILSDFNEGLNCSIDFEFCSMLLWKYNEFWVPFDTEKVNLLTFFFEIEAKDLAKIIGKETSAVENATRDDKTVGSMSADFCQVFCLLSIGSYYQYSSKEITSQFTQHKKGFEKDTPLIYIFSSLIFQWQLNHMEVCRQLII